MHTQCLPRIVCCKRCQPANAPGSTSPPSPGLLGPLTLRPYPGSSALLPSAHLLLPPLPDALDAHLSRHANPSSPPLLVPAPSMITCCCHSLKAALPGLALSFQCCSHKHCWCGTPCGLSRGQGVHGAAFVAVTQGRPTCMRADQGRTT